MKVRVELTGLKEVVERLNLLEQRVRKKVLRRMVAKGSKMLTKGMVARVQVRYGLLERSLDSVVRVYGSGKVVGIVGPRTGFKDVVGY